MRRMKRTRNIGKVSVRLAHRRAIPLLAAILCTTLWSGSARAAYQFYATIEGTKQGKFKGEGPGRDTGRIPCLQFGYQPKPPRDLALGQPGQPSGKPQHESIVIVKESGAASPQFVQALATNELLRHVTFEFVHVGADGREGVYKTLRLTNATVTSVRHLAGIGGRPPREEVTFVFQQLEALAADGKLVPMERWIGIRK